jgi:hypothetical protein
MLPMTDPAVRFRESMDEEGATKMEASKRLDRGDMSVGFIAKIQKKKKSAKTSVKFGPSI